MKANLPVPAAYYQKRELLIGLVSKADDRFYNGIDEKGTRIYFPAARFVIIGTAIDAGDNALEFLERFRYDIHAAKEVLKARVEELLADGAATLGEICSRSNWDGNVQLFAIYFILVENPRLFHHKNGVFRLNSAEEQEAFSREEDKKAQRTEFLEAVKAYLKGGGLSPEMQHRLFQELPTIAQDTGSKDLSRLIAETWPDQDLQSAVTKLRQNSGEMDMDIDPIVCASGIPVGFSDLVLAEGLVPVIGDTGAAKIFSIDDEETLDYDDAISFESTDTGFRLGIHVSNVAGQINPQGLLHSEAFRRGASFYSVNKVIPMLPPKYSEWDLSLVEGNIRPVISLYLELDGQYVIKQRSLKFEQLKVEQNLSYRQVDKQIHREPFAGIVRICNAQRAKRDVSLQGDKQRYFYYLRMINNDLQLKVIDNNSPARMMVEELMIIFNSEVAEIAREQGLPVIYRNINLYGGTDNESFPSQAYLSTVPEYHPGIGSASYLHATSPIRRYTDLVNHYQLLSLLQGKAAPFDEQDLKEKIVQIESRLLVLKELSHRSNRHWCLKIIAAKYMHEPLDVIYRGALRDLIRLEIVPWGFQILAKCDHLPKEDEFKIAVHSIDMGKGIVMADIL